MTTTEGLPNYGRVPAEMVAAAKRERARRKYCHGDWTECYECDDV